MSTENDWEDQGITEIKDGCYRCITFVRSKPVREQFVRRLVAGTWYWFCLKCNGYYGEVQGDSAIDAAMQENKK